MHQEYGIDAVLMQTLLYSFSASLAYEPTQQPSEHPAGKVVDMLPCYYANKGYDIQGPELHAMPELAQVNQLKRDRKYK